MSSSDDEDFSQFKSPGGKEGFKNRPNVSDNRDGEEGVSGIKLCGYLYKHASTITGRWHRRWCVLTSRTLYLFTERSDEQPKTTIQMNGVREMTISKKVVFTTSGLEDAFAFKLTMNDKTTKYTLDASNEKNRKLWMEHVKAVMDNPEGGRDNLDMFKKQSNQPRPVSKREQAMNEEREEMRRKQKEREAIPQHIRDAKWAAFAQDIEANEAAPAEGAPAGNARKMTFSGKSLRKLQLLSAANKADGGDSSALPGYLKSGMGQDALNDEEAMLAEGDLEDDEWDTLEQEGTLSRTRLAQAKKLFGAYDFDGTNRIDFEEFYSIIKKFDPRITPSGVRKTFDQVGAHDLEFRPTHFCKWLDLVFGKASEKDFNAGCKMLLDGASPEAVLGHAESLRHTLRTMWQWRVADVLQRKWMPELTYEEATREETTQEKKLRQTLKDVWGGGVADVLARFTTDTTPGEVGDCKQDAEICEELVYCAMENKLEQAELLLENGANPNFLGSDMRTPLITASAEGHDKMVSLLLQYGADATVTSRSGNSAFDYAKFYSHKNVAETLSDPYLYRGSTCINPLFHVTLKDKGTCPILRFFSEPGEKGEGDGRQSPR